MAMLQNPRSSNNDLCSLISSTMLDDKTQKDSELETVQVPMSDSINTAFYILGGIKVLAKSLNAETVLREIDARHKLVKELGSIYESVNLVNLSIAVNFLQELNKVLQLLPPELQSVFKIDKSSNG